jgi:putative acetyltransferase
MKIRKFKETDLAQVCELYRNTTILVNGKDYTDEQVRRWASYADDTKQWLKRIHGLYILVAEIKKTIVGFGEIRADGYIDYFYMHHDYLGKGIGTKICKGLENYAIQNKAVKLFANVSKTACGFFRKMGFEIVETMTFNVCNAPAIQYKIEKRLGRKQE